MGCSGCLNGRGCGTAGKNLTGGCSSGGGCAAGSCNKLNLFNWLGNMELPYGQVAFDIVEIRFKNSRKEFYRNADHLSLNTGDIIAVEGSPGHDVGTVSLAGELVKHQLRKKNIASKPEEFKKIYRKATSIDIDKWREAQGAEINAMHKARTIALDLKLQMKISDVEFQGDKTKATFYYTADDRVDFRELIKKLTVEFRVRIEMRHIGARQEASRLGGIGSCGRELCCSTWLTDFRTVNTSAARYQQLSLNPLKLSGQCGRLKCCLNYELDAYLDAFKDFPEARKIESNKGRAFHQKTDIFRRVMWYSYEEDKETLIALPIDRVKEIIAMNKEGKKPEDIRAIPVHAAPFVKHPDYENVVGQDNITRFDKKKKRKNRNFSHRNRRSNKQSR